VAQTDPRSALHPVAAWSSPWLTTEQKEEAMTGSGESAPMVRRAAAAVVDLVVVFGPPVAVLMGSGTVTGPIWLVAGGVLVLLVAVRWLLLGRQGWSVGQGLFGLRTVDHDTLQPVGVGRIVQRGAVVVAGGLVGGVGALVVLLSTLLDRSGSRMGWPATELPRQAPAR